MKRIMFIMLFAGACAVVFGDVTVAGVTVKDKVTYEGKQFSLNGTGIRKKLVLKLYVGSLYTINPVSDPKEVLSGPGASVMRLDIVSKIITSDLMKETIEEGFDKAMGGNTTSLRPQIDGFIGIFSDAINKGDQFTFVSLPGTGVVAYKGEKKLATIGNDKFRETLFSIWLGDDPADSKLKEAMLNR